MSLVNDLKSVFNPSKSYVTGNVISVEVDRAIVSTINGRANCGIGILSTLKANDKVHIEDGTIIGKLSDEKSLTKHFV
jgi:hypothetical protein